MATKPAPDKTRRATAQKPARRRVALKKERGVWVYEGETTESSVVAVIDRERMKRLRALTK